MSSLTFDLIGFGGLKCELFKVPHEIRVPIRTDPPASPPGKRITAAAASAAPLSVPLWGAPVLVSLGVEGSTLKAAFADEATLEEVTARLDEESLHKMIIVAMLTNPEDGGRSTANHSQTQIDSFSYFANYLVSCAGKGDNYIAEKVLVSGGDWKYRVVGIDNDHGLIPAISGGESARRVRISTKTILFAFDAITRPVPRSVLSLFADMDIEGLLLLWIHRLHSLNSEYAALFDDPYSNRLLFEKHHCFIGIPFAPDAMSRLYSKFERLKRFLLLQRSRELFAVEEAPGPTADAPPPALTPLALFAEVSIAALLLASLCSAPLSQVEPMLAERYGGKLSAFATLSPLARFRAIEGAAALVSVSRPLDMLLSYRIPADAATRSLVLENRHHGPASAMAQLEDIIRERRAVGVSLRGGVIEFRKLLLGKHVEEVLQTMDFKLLSEKESAEFLEAVESKLGLVSHLCLRNHPSLRSVHLQTWSEDAMQRLTRLDLSGCDGVNQSGMLLIAERAVSLRFLDVSGNNRGLGSMSGYLITGGALGRLVGGKRVREEPLRFGRLEYLDASACPMVREVVLAAPRLATLKLVGSSAVCFLGGELPALRSLDLRGTPSLPSGDKLANIRGLTREVREMGKMRAGASET